LKEKCKNKLSAEQQADAFNFCLISTFLPEYTKVFLLKQPSYLLETYAGVLGHNVMASSSFRTYENSFVTSAITTEQYHSQTQELHTATIY
jgi:hypothetical protein